MKKRFLLFGCNIYRDGATGQEGEIDSFDTLDEVRAEVGSWTNGYVGDVSGPERSTASVLDLELREWVDIRTGEVLS